MGALKGGDGHKHGAHLIAPVVLIGAGHAGGGQGDITAQRPPGPLGHGGGHLFRHRAVPLQYMRRNPQKVFLYLVGVGHNPPLEGGGSPGDISKPLGNQAAGAALSHAQGQVLGFQGLDDHILQRGDVHPIDLVAEQGPHLLHCRPEEGLGLAVGGRLGGNPQLALPLLGVGGQSGVGHGVHLVPQLGLHRGLPDAKELDGVGGDYPLGQGQQIGLCPVLEHGPALAGGAGEHNHMASLCLKGAAGGGAPVVLQNGTALGQHGLLKVVVRHGPAGALEIGADALGRPLVKDQLLPEGLGQYVFGEVVAGGAQAAGGDNDICPLFGQSHRLLGPLEIVPHNGVPEDVQAQLAQPLREHLGVGIGDVAQQQLSAHRQNFNGMRHRKDLLFAVNRLMGLL